MSYCNSFIALFIYPGIVPVVVVFSFTSPTKNNFYFSLSKSLNVQFSSVQFIVLTTINKLKLYYERGQIPLSTLYKLSIKINKYQCILLHVFVCKYDIYDYECKCFVNSWFSHLCRVQLNKTKNCLLSKAVFVCKVNRDA